MLKSIADYTKDRLSRAFRLLPLGWLGKAKIDGTPQSSTVFQEKLKQVISAQGHHIRFLPYADRYTEETDAIRKAYPVMLRDPYIKQALYTKVFGVASLDLQVHAASKSSRDKEIAEFIKHCIQKSRGGPRRAIVNIAIPGSIFGFSVTEINLRKPTGTGQFGKKITIESLKSKDINKLQLEGDEFGNIAGVRDKVTNQLYHASNFLIYTHMPLFESPTGISDFRAAYRAYWLADTAWQLRAIGLERYGLPVLKGTYTSDAEQYALDQQLPNVRSQGYITVPQGALVEAMDIAARGTTDFESAIRDLREEMVLAIAGAILQMLTTTGTAEMRGSADVQKGTFELLQWYLAQEAADVLNDQLFPTLVDLNYPNADHPTCTFGGVSDSAMKDSITVDQFFLQNNLPLSQEEMYEKYGRQRPLSEEDAVKPPQAQAPQMPFGGGGGFGGGQFAEDGLVDPQATAATQAKQIMSVQQVYASGKIPRSAAIANAQLIKPDLAPDAAAALFPMRQAFPDGTAEFDESFAEKWITIGGKSGDDGKKKNGGKRVIIDDATGEIKGGSVPKAWQGNKVGEKATYAKPSAKPAKPAAKPAPTPDAPVTDTDRDKAKEEFQKWWASKYGNRPATAPASTARTEEHERQVLSAIKDSNSPVIDLGELRRQMPEHLQGGSFDRAILNLADNRKIQVSQDSDPGRWTPEQRKQFVVEGDKVYTNVSIHPSFSSQRKKEDLALSKPKLQGKSSAEFDADDHEVIRDGGVLKNGKQFDQLRELLQPASESDLSGSHILLWHGTSSASAKKIIREGALKGGSRGLNATADIDHAAEYPEDTGADHLVLIRADTGGLDVDPNDLHANAVALSREGKRKEAVAENLFPKSSGFVRSSTSVGDHQVVAVINMRDGVRRGEAFDAIKNGDLLNAIYHGATVEYFKPPEPQKAGAGAAKKPKTLVAKPAPTRGRRNRPAQFDDEIDSGFAPSPPQPKIEIYWPDIRQEHSWDCGPAEIVAAGRHCGVAMPPMEYVSRECKSHTTQGTTPGKLVRTLKAYGIKCDPKTRMGLGGIKNHLESGHPCIVHVTQWDGEDHYIAIIGLEGDHLEYHDPDGGYGKISERDFVQHWDGRDRFGLRYPQWGCAILGRRGDGEEDPDKFDDGTDPEDRLIADAPHQDTDNAIRLSQATQQNGVEVVAKITEEAVARLTRLANPLQASSLFTAEERQQLADALASTLATSDLLGRSRIHLRADQVRRRGPGFKFSEPTSFQKFDDDQSPDAVKVSALPPSRALAYFATLIPTLTVSPTYTSTIANNAFTLAGVTETNILQRVKDVIQGRLESGQALRAAPTEIQRILDDAGVSVRNPNYSEMVFRTNMISSYNQGAQDAMRDPDVAELFPVWQYHGIRDGRQRLQHQAHFGRFFPTNVDFVTVRDHFYEGEPSPWNCRCTSSPVSKWEWKRLQERGEDVSILGNYPMPLK